MNIFQAILFGLIQGITEFLPVSSSGHLVLAQQIGLEDPAAADLFFDMILHAGTLAAVFLAFRKTIGKLIAAFFGTVVQIGKKQFHLKTATGEQKIIGCLFVSLLPLLVVYPFKDKLESLYSSLFAVGIALLVNSIVLFFSDRIRSGGKTAKTTGWKAALAVGAAQCVAIMPGISRSGSTITAGLAAGMKRSYAAKYSFILPIPTILAAILLEIIDMIQAPSSFHPEMIPAYIAGFLTAAISGFFAIRLLKYILKSKKFIVFSAYCLIAGTTAIVLSFIF